MGEVPRERFVAESERSRAYEDGALPIGNGQTISQPWIVASMAALLNLEGPERVLEVGTGSGYGAAVLAKLCSHVVTIERHPALAAKAKEVLAELGIRNVEVRTGDGSAGVPDRAPFDAIVVTAAAEAGTPPALLEQLAPGRTARMPDRAPPPRAARASSAMAWSRRSRPCASSPWSKARLETGVLGGGRRGPPVRRRT